MKLNSIEFGEGPPLVLLHGFTGSAETWMPYRREVQGHRVISIDLPGHGGSPMPPAGASFEDVSDAVASVLDGYGVTDAGWLGYSMGGRVALQVAVRHSDRVARLVVESASPGIPDPTERAGRAAADDALAERIVRDGLETFVDRWAAQPLFATQKRLASEVLAREREARLANTADGIAAGLRALSVGRQPSLWESLGEVTIPTLLLVGADDQKYVAIGRRARTVMPRAHLEVVPDAGHTVHLEKPTAFWRSVRAFLSADGV